MTAKNSKGLRKSWHYKLYSAFQSEVRAAAEKWFEDKEYATAAKRPYCLSGGRESWPGNIISDQVVEYIQSTKEQHEQERTCFPLHKYLHHGLSSQAMLFNLLGPLKVRGDLTPLENMVAAAGIKGPVGNVDLTFEFDDRSVFNEDAGQPTSIDACLHGDSGNAVFIEAKFAESGFGGCSVFSRGDCAGRNPSPDRFSECYLHHIGRAYWQRMKELGMTESPLLQGRICPFVSYYQFFREAMFALHLGGSFLLLHDSRNPAYVKERDGDGEQAGLWPFLLESIPDQYRDRIGRVTVQDLVAEIKRHNIHSDWIDLFEAKYGLKGKRAPAG
ncbi:PGN_0703 family putative restriction endonuclease [Desulfovibrio oxyclinae]|uniref:PGN_0703 family putative restriction endonuclease n=1 Tax=Desulfovibrio oxyclinae TaxID=63560 RepID=UPI00036965CF|nr:hypothetical protein [Desulfovibrio oxyclinae]